MSATIQQDLLEAAPTIPVRQLGFNPYVYPWLSDLPLYVLLEGNDEPVLALIDEKYIMYEYGETSPLLVIKRDDVGACEFVFSQFLKRGIIYRVTFPESKKISHKIKHKRRQKVLDGRDKTLQGHKIIPAATDWFMRRRYAPQEIKSMILGKYELSHSPRHAHFSESIRILNKAFSDIQSYGGYKGAMRILEQNMDRTDWSRIDYELVDSIEIYEACMYCN